jgi:hypothetical protein
MKVITLEVTVIFVTSPFYIDVQDYSIFLCATQWLISYIMNQFKKSCIYVYEDAETSL